MKVLVEGRFATKDERFTKATAVTDSDGKFKIADVPIGTWKLKVWNELLTPKQLDKTYEVKIEEGKETSIELEP